MKSHRTLIAAIALAALGAATALAQPSVAVDQPDYHPFSTVYIAGAGFQAGETVQCQILRIDIDDNSGSEHQPWQVTADAVGNFQASWYVTLHEAGATLRLTATGQRSGLAAQTTFTDSYHFIGVSAGPQSPNPVPAGSAATYLITASISGGGNETVTFSCSGLPSGVAAAFSPATVSASPWQSTLTLTASSSVASGTYSNITVTGTGRGDDRSVQNTTISLVTGKRAITVTAAANTKSYDGTTNATARPTLTAGTLAPGDTATYAETYDTKNVGTGKMLTPTVSIKNSSHLNVTTNYAITKVNSTAGVINAAALAITANNDNKVYGQARSYGAGSTAFSGSGLQNRETIGSVTITASGGTAANTAVGSYGLTPNAATGGTFAATNYSISYRRGTLTVTPAPLTVTPDAQSKAYGNADPRLTYRITRGALVNGDSLSGALSRVAGQNVGSYAIQQGTLAASGNYALSYVGANLSITARPITVTAVTDEKVYDGTTSSARTPVITSGSLVNGDTAVFTQAFNTKEVLTAHTLIPAGSISDGNGGQNYSITFSNIVTYSILPRPLTVAAADASRVYGAPNPAFSVSYSGFVPGENASVLNGSPSLSTTAASNSPVSGSPYAITAAQNTLSNANYSFSFTNGQLTITPASATVGVASDKWTVPPTNTVTFAFAAFANAPSTAVAGGSVQFVANGTNNLGTVALVNGQATLSVLGSTLAHGSNSITAVFSDANGNFNGSSADLNPKQVVNYAPLSGVHPLQTKLNTPVTLNAAELSALDRDPDADGLTVIAAGATSSAGGTVSLTGGTITYLPPNNYAGSDSFSYTIADAFGGTNNATVNVSISSGATPVLISQIVPLPDRNRKLVAAGVPGKTYLIQASRDLVHWQTISTNVAPADSVITLNDLTATNYPSRFYRLSSEQ